MSEHVHVWVKLAKGVYRCDGWPRCEAMWFAESITGWPTLRGFAKTGSFPRRPAGRIL